MAHSRYFSPSAANTWMLCPGSAQLNADKESKSSPDAERGTNLHTFMQENFGCEGDPDYTALPEGDRDDAKKALEMAWEVCLEFEDERLLEKEVNLLLPIPDKRTPILDEFGDQCLHDGGTPIYEDEIFGTVDLIGYNAREKHLLILDYKFGYGEVDPTMNRQLLIYALGARRIFAKIGIDNITLCIVQPQRSNRPKLFTLTNAELNDWNDNVLLPAWKAVMAKEKTLVVGDSQCQWCRSKVDCPARLQEIDDIFSEGNATTAQEDKSVFDKLEMVSRLRNWCNAVEAEAQSRLEAGETDPRWKLVRGKSNRRWANEDDAANFLKNRGFKEKERYRWKVIGIPEAEKLVAPKIADSVKLQNAFQRLIVKPEGKLTYAPANDKREGVEIQKVENIIKEFDDELDSL